MIRLFVLLLSLSASTQSFAQAAYKIYTPKGKEISYEKMLKKVAKKDMLFLGELHNNSMCHWLELQLTKDLFDLKGQNLVLGAEMFETDDQLKLNEYLLGIISTKNFEAEAKLWNNYKTDYKPLVEFAKTEGLKFVATNVPRRYASFVFRQGLDALPTLSEHAQAYLAPLPIPQDMEVKCYADMLAMGGEDPKFPQAQMIKDATMAHSILQNWEKNEFFLHFNGSYHSNRHEGIIWYLKKYNKEPEVAVISMVEQDDISTLDTTHADSGDFIICIPTSMTKTY